MSETLIAFLTSQIVTAPFLIAYIIGIILAFDRYPRQGKSALYAGLGFGLFAIGSLINSAQMYWLMASRRDSVAAAEVTRVVVLAVSASRLAELAGLILVMLAVFDSRKRVDGDSMVH